MKNNVNTTSSATSTKVNNKKQSTTAKDDMEKAVAKAERIARIESNKAKRLEIATKRLEALKQVNTTAKGFANITLSNVHTTNAINASVQGAIDSLNAFIKQVATVNGLDKKIVATLKGEAAQTILKQITESTLPLYIDNKGLYKVESLYRLVASKAKNTELKTLLNNLEKSNK